MTDLFNPETVFGDKLKLNEPLSKYTTMGVGGPADYFISVNTAEEMLLAVTTARRFDLPFLVMGKGSNTIISDKGLRGLVIQNNILTLDLLENYQTNAGTVTVADRHENIDKSLEIDTYGLAWDQDTPTQYLRVGTGWKLMVLINKCIGQGLVGLEWFYGIAGSVGGAVYMNVHGGTKQFFSHFVVEVEVINERNEIELLPADQLEFDYDNSIFHRRKLIMTNVVLRLFKGDTEKAQRVVDEWGRDKIIKQPQRSSGCMFQNLPIDRQKQLGLPTPSMGYVIDKELHLGGTKIGGAMISSRHCAFVENTGSATASDIKALVDLVKARTQEKFGFTPELEVEFIGEF